MFLTEVHVTNFRSAEDSGVFGVNQVTCLVGKNEAGKSAILLALAALNPHDSTPATLNKERDYGLEGANVLTPERLALANPKTERSVKRAEAAFAVMPPEIPEFDHFTPSSWLIRNPKTLDGAKPPVKATLSTAQGIFDTYNALLS